MFMKDDAKKKIAAMISSKPAPEKPEQEENEDEGLDSAIQDIMSAIESKNPQMMKEALKAFIHMCPDDSEYEEESEPSEME